VEYQQYSADSHGLLGAISSAWLHVLRCAQEYKKRVFQDRADECMSYYDGPQHQCFSRSHFSKPHCGLWCDDGVAVPRMQVAVNKVFEAVTLLLPIIMHRNPTRNVTAFQRRLPDTVRQVLFALGAQPPDADPMASAMRDCRAWLMEQVVNATPYEMGLKIQSRHALVEALVKGRGILWTEYADCGGVMVPASRYDSVDHLLLDPDFEQVKDCGWAARRRIQPVNMAEDRFELARGSLRGNRESAPMRNRNDADCRELSLAGREYGRRRDLIEYWEIYSRRGMGGRLYGASNPLKDTIEAFGQNVYLVVAEGVPYPLNLPPDMPPDEQEIKRRVSWPIPVADDPSHPWPFVHCDFTYKPRELWPVPWMWPGMGLQKLLSWLYSFMASHIQVASRQFMAVPQDIEEELEEKILRGGDLELLKIRRDHAGTFEQFIQFVQHPEVNRDFWTYLQAVDHAWERSTGITELLHGYVGGRQMRSAEEAAVRSENTMLRPDDMADTVEDWQSLAARNEGLAWRALGAQGAYSVARIFREQFSLADPFAPQIGPYTGMWMQLMGGASPADVLYEFDYRIASGSARKPNRMKERQDIDESAQVVMPALMGDYQQWGDPSMVNGWFRKWAETRDFDPGLIQFPDRRPQVMAQLMQQFMQQSSKSNAGLGGAPGAGGPPQPMNPREQELAMAAQAGSVPQQLLGGV